MQPSPDFYLEDLHPGMRFETGSVTLTEDDIIGFASGYDPQYFHLDPEAAKHSAFGGHIASGLQTLCVTLRLFFDMNLWPAAIIGSPGMNEIRWLKPVRPGDTLSSTFVFTDVRHSSSKPDRGIATTFHETRNQHGDLVFTADCLHMIRARAAR